MQFWASTSFSPPEHYVPLARAADEAGLHGLLQSDHLFYPQQLETPYPYSDDGQPIWPAETAWPDVWVMTGAMAAVTSRIRFGTAVYIAPARDVFTVAKQVGTAAVVSDNRVSFGVGVGWMREEFAQTGQTFTNRGRRLDDMIPALRELWSGGWVEHHGPHYDFGPLQIEPAPTAPIPIWTGGNSDAALQRAASLCDGWIGTAYASVEELEVLLARLRGMRAAAGRAAEPFEIIVGLMVPPTAEVVDRVAALGVTGLMCAPWYLDERTHDRGIADASRGTDLDRKIEATYRFADMVKPLAD